MSGTNNLDWIWYAAGIVLAGVGLAIAYWALLHDRARGRKRCPKCWYDMTGATPGAGGAYFCPECGKLIVKTRKLRKTHRRWGRGMLAISMIVASAVIGPWPKLRNNGWTAYVPKSLLVRGTPLDANSRIGRALAFQLYEDLVLNDALSNAEIGVFLDRALGVNGDLGLGFSIRDSWPRDIPLGLRSRSGFLQWLLWGRHLTVWGRVKASGGDWTKIGDLDDDFPLTTELLLPTEGNQCSIEIELREEDDVFWRSGPISIDLVDSVDEILAPVTDPAIEALIARVLSPGLLADDPIPSSIILAQFGYTLSPREQHLMQDAIWGLAVEIRNKERFVATGSILLSQHTVSRGTSNSRTVDLEWDIPALRKACDDPNAEWRIVVRGDPRAALRDVGRDRYWAGELKFEFNWIELERWCLDNDAY